jgi:DNA-binding NarL/FixJ family response regulator
VSAIRVVVGEDGYFPRQGIERALQSMEDVRHVGTHPDVEALHEAIRADPPDVVVTNLRVASSDSEEDLLLVAKLRDSHPEVGVLVLTEHTGSVYVRRVFASGIEGRGYLVNDRIEGPDTFRTALRSVAGGRSYLDPTVVAPLLADAHEAWIDSFTAREIEVLRTMSEGLSNAAIAHVEGITTRAVERHVSTIFSKLGLTDNREINRRVAAVRLYLANQSNGSDQRRLGRSPTRSRTAGSAYSVQDRRLQDRDRRDAAISVCGGAVP